MQGAVGYLQTMLLNFEQYDDKVGQVEIEAAILDGGDLTVISNGEPTKLGSFSGVAYRLDDGFADAYSALEHQHELGFEAFADEGALQVVLSGRTNDEGLIWKNDSVSLVTSTQGVSVSSGAWVAAKWNDWDQIWRGHDGETLTRRLLIAPAAYFAALPATPIGPRQRLSALAVGRTIGAGTR